VRFLNRSTERELLERRMSSDVAEFLVVYGRRRVGKTELLAHVASHVRSFWPAVGCLFSRTRYSPAGCTAATPAS